MRNKLGFFVLSLCTTLAPGARAWGQQLSELTLPAGGNGRSQRAEVSQWVGPVKISIDYHSPSVHGSGGTDRSGHIWGELVKYGFFDEGFGPSRATPWRAGANESTTFTVSHDVKIEGQDLKAGTYALFLALEKDGPWTWIFSTQTTGWGSFQYDSKYDALRVAAIPETAPYTEYLMYGFDSRKEDATLAFLQWETKRIPMKIDVPNVNELYVDAMRKELLGWPGFNYQNWQTAAQFCADARINLDEALVWAERAISEPFRGGAFGREDFSTLSTKSAVLEAMGRQAEATAVMDKAMRIPGTPLLTMHVYASGLLAAGKSDRALAAFRINQQSHPEEKYWTYLGLARAYTALGDKTNAIKNWEIALRSVPDFQKGNLPRFEKILQGLKGGK